MRRLFVVFAIVCISAFVNIKAQEILVKECNILANGESAVYIPDANGDLCALLKIKTNNIEGLTFPNESQYVGEVKEENGVYYVYIPSIMYKLSFSHKDYMPGIIDLSQFGYKKNIRGGKTYEIILEAPLAKSTDAFVSFKVIPYIENCKVIINNESKLLPEDGILEFKCSPGSYDYTIIAKGYEPHVGNVDVVSGVVPISVNMQPETVAVDVMVNVDASIYIDDVYYGNSGLQRLPQGNHKLRASASGYIDEEKNILIDENTKVVSFVLKENKGKTIDVHAVPVIVHCDTRKLYKNNKEIPGWRNGEAIMLMPNTKCRLTNDFGSGAILQVSDEPMEIEIVGNSIRYLSDSPKEKKKSKESVVGSSTLKSRQMATHKEVTITTFVNSDYIYVDNENMGTSPYTGNLSVGKHTVYAVRDNIVGVETEFEVPQIGTIPAIVLVFNSKKDMVISQNIEPDGSILAEVDNSRNVSATEQSPMFPGGDIALKEFIQKNLKYPSFEADNGIQGTVYLSFFVETDGSITDIKENRSPSDNLTREAKRLVSIMPKWNPGKKNGVPARAKYDLPVRFKL